MLRGPECRRRGDHSLFLSFFQAETVEAGAGSVRSGLFYGLFSQGANPFSLTRMKGLWRISWAIVENGPWPDMRTVTEGKPEIRR